MEHICEPNKSTQWILHIDCKEPEGKTFCEEIASYNISAKVDNLSVADYWFCKDGKIWGAIERKNILDLVASTRDGRYDDQTSRMLKSTIPHMFFLVIGSIEQLDGSDQQTVNSAILHLQMHRQLRVHYIPHKGHIKPFFIKLFNYLCQDPNLERITAPLYETIQTTCKKRKLETQELVYAAQLMVFPGMSEAKAKSIIQFYKDIPTLVKAYQSLPDQKMKLDMLKGLPCEGKKIGSVLSEKIYRHIMNDNTPYQPPEKGTKKQRKSRD